MEPIKNSGTQQAAVFFHLVARHILAQHAGEMPDLRGATVLLPNYHVAQPLALALSREVNHAALLLPQMMTLNDWAQTIPLAQAIQPDTQRIAALYQALRTRRWFADADLWSLSRELLGLMDDLTRHHVALPESAAEFSQTRRSLPGAPPQVWPPDAADRPLFPAVRSHRETRDPRARRLRRSRIQRLNARPAPR